MKKYWIITDPHIYHEKVKKFCNRPDDFDSRIYKGLSRLGKDGILICLGDIAFGDVEKAHQIFIEPLQCTKILVKGNHDKKCLSKNTRLLTKEGYKFYHELEEGEIIPTVNLKTGKVEYKPINDIYTYKNVSKLHVAESRSGKMELTGHHVVINQLGSQRTTNKWKKQLAENLWNSKTAFKVPVSFGSNSYYAISDDYLKLMAWIITDGSILPSNKVIIYQSKERYIKEIRILLNILNIDFKERIRNREIKQIAGKTIKSSLPQHIFSLDIAQSREFLKEVGLTSKYNVPESLWGLSDDQFETFLNEMIKGDGTFKKEGTKVLWGKREFLLKIMGLCVTHNKSANICKQTGRPNYYLTIRCKNTGKQFNQAHTSIKPYNDTVWCVNVDNNVIFVELNGKTYVTGNSDSWYYDHGWDFVCITFRNIYFGKNILFSHHPKVWDGHYDYNFHGHFHNLDIEKWEPELTKVMTHRHVLISIEENGYQPISLNKIVSHLSKEK